jgi:hypothetical protein
MADGKAIPYGIYDLTANRGSVFVGTSHDTPSFAADCLGRWWKKEGCERYPSATNLLVLADNGGSNSPRCAQWLCGLARNLCNEHGISVTVCHYPPGASKWNPIENRLFSEISKNWAAVPLRSYETVLKYIRTTRTQTGLRVSAYFVKKYYPTKQKPTQQELQNLAIKDDRQLPQWNYTVKAN